MNYLYGARSSGAIPLILRSPASQRQDGVTYFRFPDQLNNCAEWLGLPTPVPQLNEEAEESKPFLTQEQENAIRVMYAEDISLWESLRQNII